MHRLITIVLALAVLYGGYWLIASRGVESTVEAELARLQQAGLADVADVSLTGFPSRFDLTFDAPAMLDRSGLYGWRAPFLQVFALSYRPNHIIAVWPNEQEVMLAGLPLTLTSTDMRASAKVAGTDAALDRVVFVAKSIGLEPPDATGLAIEEARMATQRLDAEGARHELGLALLRLSPDPALRAALDPSGALPDTLDWLRLDADLSFDKPLDRFAAGSGPPRLRAIDLRELSLRWGDLSVEGKGPVEVDAAGRLVGRIDLVVKEWRHLVRFAAIAGMVRAEIAPTFEAALEQIDEADGDPEVLRVPLTWKNGRTSLGPIPLGPAPRL